MIQEYNRLSSEQQDCIWELIRIMNRDPTCSPLRAINDAFSLIAPKARKTLHSCTEIMMRYNRIKDRS
jgi:hypothetical protein